MPLTAGERLGHYEILSLLGTGGMGEVYLAKDTRLDRHVAIKVSAQQFNERFEREAKVVASLNHPNICALYDVGPNYLVMELVEGPSLSERIKEGALPWDEAISIARQIADALEFAHDRNVVHRDLKPQNIKITNDGVVKVLDFGLAKITPSTPPQDATTLTMASTQIGMILGSPGYMSPEQARGKPTDKRADIWAFGIVLYEMLTGKPAFEAETFSDSLAATLTKEPEWAAVPVRARRLLRRCLEKDPKKRLRDIGDAMALIDDKQDDKEGDRQAAAQTKRSYLWPAAAALGFLIASGVSFRHFRETPPEPPSTVRFRMPIPAVLTSGVFAVSPDGRRLVFAGVGNDGVPRLWLRNMDSLDAHPLADIELTTRTPEAVFWSPDSRFVAFSTAGKLEKIDTNGGPAQILCDVTDGGFAGGAWNREGVILFGSTKGIQRVPAGGGIPTPLTKLAGKEVLHVYPMFLPDGDHFLYARFTPQTAGTEVFMGSLKAKPEEQSTKQIFAPGLAPQYLATADPKVGRVLFIRESTLYAQNFDNTGFELTGEPTTVAEQVDSYGNRLAGLFSVSENGILVYKPTASRDLQLTWMDREGKQQQTIGEPGRYGVVALSPDATHAATSLRDARNRNTEDVWVQDLVHGTGARFTFDAANDIQPVWSKDGTRIAFASDRGGKWSVFIKDSNGAGAEELIYASDTEENLSDWSRDGRFLMYHARQKTGGAWDLMLLPLTGDRKPIPFLQTPANEFSGHFSPDGRWVAYISNETGQNEIYVQEFDSATGKPGPGRWMVSKGTLGMPRWRGDGKELFYLMSDGTVMSVAVTTNPTFRAGAPTALFRVPSTFLRTGTNPGALGDVSSDGKRFLFAMPVEGSREELTIVLNWNRDRQGAGSATP